MITYLSNLTNDIINNNGLVKIFFIRLGIIHIKHTIKKFFICNSHDKSNKEKIESLMNDLGIDYYDYICYIFQRIRDLLKINRYINLGDSAVRLIRGRLFKSIKNILLFDKLNSIILLDFDGVITNRNFVEYFLNRIKYSNFKICIVTANRSANIKEYFEKQTGIKISNDNIFISKTGKKGKIKLIKNIAVKNTKVPILYFDDEDEYLKYGNFMLMIPFKVLKNGKFKLFNNFK